MKSYRGIVFASLGALFLMIAVPGYAGDEKPDLPQWAKDAKQPCEYFDWGMDLRVRNERFPDAIDLNPDARDTLREWWRIRTRLYFNVKPMEDMTFRVRLVNESRPVESPDHYVSANPHDSYDHFDEVLPDIFHLELKEIGESPLTLRIGRQDMLAVPGQTGPNGTGFGDGFMFMDGTPGDGSRTFFFDAVRLTLNLEGWIEKSSLDIIAIDNQPYARHHLGALFDDDYRRLEDWDSEAYALYFKNASWIPNSQWDLYYIYKIEERRKIERWEKPNAALDPGSHFHTVGTRFSGKLAEQTSYALEGAVQEGAWDFKDRRGFATQESLEQKIPGWGSPSIQAYHCYLSGDDPGTSRNEAFKPVYSRWPKWGELIGYMGPQEHGTIYYFTNMHVLALTGGISPIRDVRLTAIAQWLYADETPYADQSANGGAAYPYVSASKAAKFGDGKYRGFNPQLKLAWAPTKYLDAHILWEYLDPGKYFEGTANDRDYYFIRGEVALKF